MSIDVVAGLAAVVSAFQQSDSVSLRTIGLVMIVILGTQAIRGRVKR